MLLKGASSDDNKPPKTKRVVYKWTPQAHEVYIEILKDAVDRGERTDTGFKPSVESEAVDTVYLYLVLPASLLLAS